MIKAYKINAMNLARHHKKHCKESDCNVSLLLLRAISETIGVNFTKEQKELFM